MDRKNAAVDINLRTHPAGRIALIALHLNGPLHILNRAGMDAFIAAFDQLRPIDDLRAVILTGATDRAFIGGADIKEMVALNPESARAFITRLHEMNAAIRSLPVPVIARITGYCLGAGLEVAAACDFRAAALDAKFGMPEVLVGIPSVIEAALLPQLIGWGKTRELLYTGRTIDAQEALQCRLIERVGFPPPTRRPHRRLDPIHPPRRPPRHPTPKRTHPRPGKTSPQKPPPKPASKSSPAPTKPTNPKPSCKPS